MPVQQQTPLDFRITLFRVQTVIRRQDAHLMPRCFRASETDSQRKSNVPAWCGGNRLVKTRIFTRAK